MNRALFAHTWRSQRLKLAIVCLGLAIWSALLPIVYGTFGQTFKSIIDSGLIPKELTQFGGGARSQCGLARWRRWLEQRLQFLGFTGNLPLLRRKVERWASR